MQHPTLALPVMRSSLAPRRRHLATMSPLTASPLYFKLPDWLLSRLWVVEDIVTMGSWDYTTPSMLLLVKGIYVRSSGCQT